MKALLKALRPRATDGNASSGAAAPDDVTALCAELGQLCSELRALRALAAEAHERVDDLLAAERERVNERASLAAMPRAKLLTKAIELEGRPTERRRVTRLTVGEPVERPFSRSIGITRCATAAADVRELWNRLLAFEAQCGDDVLRGLPSTVLDVPGASVSLSERGSLRIVPGVARSAELPVIAVPRFTYDFTLKKLHNFGHWLLDCLPQVAVLATVAPDAVFLLPQPYKQFQVATLGLLGIARSQLRPWDGSPIECNRLLAFESDGRTGGGRPLSPLMEVRRTLGVGDDLASRRHRRIYVSRRDAGVSRQWVTNEADVEALFRSRGFEVIVMGDCSLDEQVRIFREAGVVAGVSGAGLADIVFSAPGTQLIVLMSDSHIRWYADDEGARSSWSGSRREAGKALAAFGDSPRFYVHLAAAFEQVSHSFVANDHMPIDELTAFVDDVLAVVNGA